MKIIGISDLHGYLPELDECDVVCICGDIVPLEIQKDIFQSWWWFNNVFKSWCDSLKCEKIIFIGGNHDFFLEGEDPFQLDKIVYLCDSEYTHNGIKFWGSPWITGLPNWAFNLNEYEQEKKFEHIPNDCDILITHTPPFNVCDIGRVDFRQGHPIDYGSKSLTKVLSNFSPKKHIKFALSGHIHSGNHDMVKLGDIILHNCSLKDETYTILYKPVKIYL